MTDQRIAADVFEKVTLPGIDDDDGRTLNRLLEQLQAKRKRNSLRSAYYDGKRAIQQVGSIIPPQYTQLGIVLGWSAKSVDLLARRCNLDGVVWPGGELDDLGFDKFADDNMLFSEVSSAGVSSLTHGVAFSINTTGDEDEPESLLHFKDAMNATGDWNSRRRRMDNLLSVVSRDDEGRPDSLALYLDGRTLTSRKSDGRWSEVETEEHDWGVPVERIPYQPSLTRPMGRSRISRPLMSLHDQALRIVIRMEGHMDVYSFPEMWMLGADASIFKNDDGTVKPVWQTMLARIKGIPDDDEAPESLARADVKQFPAQSPQPHLDALKQKAQLFSGEANIPLTSLGVSDMTNPTSADSYVASREDLIAEAEGTTDDWGPPLRRAIARGLAILNDEKGIPDSWASMALRWRSPMYLSRAAQADAGAKQIGAVPWLAETSVGLKLLGLSEQDRTIALAERRRNNGRATLQAVFSHPAPQLSDANGAPADTD